ncbi:MAG: glycosyltransferase [candidate division Zixibacteria bacterium]|nr:glycosyltransferase [candidate division Zixibacteria bacterium]
MRPPLRILVLADSRAFHTERYVRELRIQGCRVLLGSLEHGSTIHLHLKRLGPIQQLHYLLATMQVRHIINRFAPDIINAHFATGYGWLAGRAVDTGSTPVVLHLWGSDILQVPNRSTFHRRKARRALAAADLTLGDSQYLLDQAAMIHPPENSCVKYWGIERQYLALADPDRPLSRPLRIIVPRQHESVYNNSLVLRGLHRLLSEKKVTLTVPAFGSLYHEFKNQAGSLPSNSIQYYNRLPRDQFMALMSRHDLYLSASQSDSSPASLIEAMGLGLIPVAADIPGVREWLTPQSGYRFTSGDADDLGRVINEIVNTGNTFADLRKRNHERVLREAVFENTVAETINLMLALLEKQS